MTQTPQISCRAIIAVLLLSNSLPPGFRSPEGYRQRVLHEMPVVGAQSWARKPLHDRKLQPIAAYCSFWGGFPCRLAARDAIDNEF